LTRRPQPEGGEAPPVGGAESLGAGAGVVGALLGEAAGGALVAGCEAGVDRATVWVSVGVGDVDRFAVECGRGRIDACVLGACRCLGVGEEVTGVGWSWLAGVPATPTPTAPVRPPAAALVRARTSVVRR